MVGSPLLVRDSGWRGTNTDKLIVDEFLDFEYRDIEEASPASAFLKNTWSSWAPNVGDADVDVGADASDCCARVDERDGRMGEGGTCRGSNLWI